MAGDNVVGILKAVLSADTSAFTAAMQSASADTQKLAKALQSDLEPSQRAVNTAVQQFLSGDVLKRAQTYAAALGDIKDASLLSESAQRKANAAATDAIALYQKLGLEAPADMLALRDATMQTTTAWDTMSAAANGLKSVLGPLGVVLGVGEIVSFG